MAFRATRHVLGALQKERNDVQLSLKKAWKTHQHTDGLVTRTMSPYQVDLYSSWIKSWPSKLKSRWTETGPELLLALFMGPGLIKIAKWEHETVKYGNRD